MVSHACNSSEKKKHRMPALLFDVSEFSEVGHKMFGRVTLELHPVQFLITQGKTFHKLLIRTFGVEPAALTEPPDEFLGGGGGNPAAVRQFIIFYHTATANFLVRNLKNSFCFSSRNGRRSNVVRLGNCPVRAKIIKPLMNRIHFSIFAKLIVPECWRNSTVR